MSNVPFFRFIDDPAMVPFHFVQSRALQSRLLRHEVRHFRSEVVCPRGGIYALLLHLRKAVLHVIVKALYESVQLWKSSEEYWTLIKLL